MIYRPDPSVVRCKSSPGGFISASGREYFKKGFGEYAVTLDYDDNGRMILGDRLSTWKGSQKGLAKVTFENGINTKIEAM